jgi:predicted dehydrogenase
MKKTGMGIIGPGFVATHHIDAVRRLGNVEVVAVAGSTQKSADAKARELRIGRAYGHYQDLIDDPEIQVVHNTTPNYLHYSISLAAIAAGKHVISDKPLAMNSAEGRLLLDAAKEAGVAHVVTFNYRGNPLIQHARSMVAGGELGSLCFVHGHYLQDWMTDPSVYSWRSDPQKGGSSSALTDIGSHWCDLAEHVVGSRIKAVLADLTTVVPVRYSAGKSAEAFTKGDHKTSAEVHVEGEDLASVLIRFENGAKGSFSVGQVLPGNKNNVQLEISGRECSLRWQQERQNELWIGYHDQPNRVMAKDPAFVSDGARRYVHLPGGHQEAWSDAFFNVIRDAYEWISAGAGPEAKPDALATFADGYRAHCLIEAMIASHGEGGRWTEVESHSARAATASLQTK